MEEPVWHQQDWQWDPISMVAKPAESKMRAMKLAASASQASEASEEHRVKSGCQVDNCTADLSAMREYHMRYKICEFHLKAPVVIKDGREQRFCQQCGKFQLREEFDGEKRSCRARLEKHNARRRRQREVQHLLKKGVKLDPKAVIEQYNMDEQELASKVAKLQEQGYKVDLAQPLPAHGSGGRTMTTATGAEDSEFFTSMATPQPFSMDAAVAGLQGLQLPEVASRSSHASAGSAAQAAALGGPVTPAAGAGFGATMPDAATLDLLGSDMALLDDDFLEAVLTPTMLPSQQPLPGQLAPTQFLEMDPSQLMDLDDMAILEEISAEYGLAPPPGVPGLAPPHGVSTPMFSDVASASALLPPYQAAALPPAAAGGFGFAAPPGADLPPYMTAPPAMQAEQPPLLPPFQNIGHASSLASATTQSSRVSAAASNIDSMSVIDEALNLLAYDAAQVTYIPEDKLFRFSAKLFNCTPDQLPSDLKASLINMLTCNSLEGYIRPGCVHVTVDALMGPEEREAMATQGVRGVVERLVAQQPEAFWAQHTMLVQLGDKMALVREGQVVHVLATAGSTQVFPRISAVRPLVAMPEADGSTLVTLWGYNLAGGEENDVVLARSQGKYVNVERVGEVATDPSWGGMQRMQLRVAGAELGAMQLEIMRGGFISSSKTLLVHLDAQLAAELRQLESDQTGMDIDTTLFELGRVVEFGAGGRAAAAWGPEERAKAGKAARRMLAFAIQRKWVGVTRALLAGIAADCRPLDAVAAADVMAAGTTGMPLLQLAVRTQSKELVASLLAWGRAKGYSFKATTPGRRGLTALHLAALIRDQGVIAGMITEMCDDAVTGWETATAEDGTTPMAFAQAHGNADIIRHLITAKQLKKALAAGQTLAQAPSPAGPFSLSSALAEDGGAPSPRRAESPAAPAAAPAAAPPSKAAVAASTASALAAAAAAAGRGPNAAPKPQQQAEQAAAKEECQLETAASSSSMEFLHDSAKSMAGGSPRGLRAHAAVAAKAGVEFAAAPSPSKPAAAAAASCGKGKGKCVDDIDEMVPLPAEEQEEDEIARQKSEGKMRRRALQATSAALTFRDPALEGKYAKWYHSGQVPVDVAFIVIAVLSQGAWIFRWSLEHSALGLCMVALMAMNAALIQLAVMFPATYRKYREPLCILSHLVHKIVQLLVTVVPPVGTIYSPTYNTTVAILESSSFAQVLMLSFGVKMRFAFHVFVNLFHLAISTVVNDHICAAAWPRIPGGLCHVGLLAFQMGACFLLPSALVYLTERRSRRIFLETVID